MRKYSNGPSSPVAQVADSNDNEDDHMVLVDELYLEKSGQQLAASFNEANKSG